ncbi:MAG: MYG1 family protein [Candidatus Paceibacterota bacterium]|jgi:uncharacterized UPF0160 family protein
MSNKKLITHDGTFHTDEIFACATLVLICEKEGAGYEIIRTRDEEIIKTGDYVFDVGGIYDALNNKFDHHQPGGAGSRENGIEHASFGLVWKKFGIELCDNQKVADQVDKKLVSPIDAWDNGIDLFESKTDIVPYSINHVFFGMLPTWREEDVNKDEVFIKCVELAKNILSREIIHRNAVVAAEDSVLKIYNETTDKRIIVLDNNYPFESNLFKFPEPIFVIYPRKTDHTWGAKAIKADLKTFKNRKDFPASWGGLQNEEFQKITGVSDAFFCHHSLYLVAAKSKEGAIKLAQIALES